jgi:hypothetical protein
LSISTEAKERPILFTGPMVRAVRAGIKTQTRRVFKMPPGMRWYGGPGELGGEATGDVCEIDGNGWWSVDELSCPHGDVGDRLWVRESFVTGHRAEGGELLHCDEHGNPIPETVWYRADDEDFFWLDEDGGFEGRVPWKPSIHMPRHLCRLVLEITDIRVERIQSISHEDILAEGITGELAERSIESPPSSPGREAYSREAWRLLWDSINGERDDGRYRWDLNPWAWAITFRRVEG